MTMLNLIPCILLGIGAMPLWADDAGTWISLIQGDSLKGWKVEGNADWTVSGGVITGRQGPNAVGGDLFTEQEWADFELEAEWKMRFPGNSGIWFRRAAPRSGYQADILDQPTHPGVLSGSLYWMGKGMIAENRDASSVNKDGWNQLRIRAKGDLIEIWQNGKKVISARDSTFAGPGSIGIQLHRGKPFEGMEVLVRKLRVRGL
ncbi:MAG: DUF1080 domain-containing protein [Methylotetracoccus sp.]|nr:DUF1080 domain-containing protein [Methylotetracoccus sp.]